ncbi:Arm DNA-binding domain-containing protein [Flavobacterium frigidarium]|uniref:Arm DNA-binding domain-containing protein n=1 Tax=Flavobacterium frigidarium TaxID=99286 RepID=UPI00040B08AC|nr:Arm DNA-binding domain-containing protein [Flavobacterium frigidarium]
MNYVRKQFWACYLFAPPRNESKIRTIYLRITVDGIPKETSTKRKWDISRWDQKLERAIGTKEDAKSIDMFLESLAMKINEYKTESMYNGKQITAQKVMDYILGKCYESQST